MKYLILIIATIFSFGNGHAQFINWQHKDLERDTIFGTSTTKAFIELLSNKKSTKVIVAIVDSGVDTLHEDLKGMFYGGQSWSAWLELYREGNRKGGYNSLTGDRKNFTIVCLSVLFQRHTGQITSVIKKCHLV